jgi:mono/diheme cytochrome c family protein
MGCGNCHTPLGQMGEVAGQELSGRLVEENPAFTAIAPNITPAGEVATGRMRNWPAPSAKGSDPMAA